MRPWPAGSRRWSGLPFASAASSLGALSRQRRQVTDAKLAKLVTDIGPGRVLAALDKITAPNGNGHASV
jgi:hypothetical protein